VDLAQIHYLKQKLDISPDHSEGQVGVLAIWTGENKAILTVDRRDCWKVCRPAAVAIEGILLSEEP